MGQDQTNVNTVAVINVQPGPSAGPLPTDESVTSGTESVTNPSRKNCNNETSKSTHEDLASTSSTLDIRNFHQISNDNFLKMLHGRIPVPNATEFENLESAQPTNTSERPKANYHNLYYHNLFVSQANVALMFLFITLIFILSWIPFWLTKLSIIRYNSILHYLFYFNHASNIFIYMYYNRAFREIIITRVLKLREQYI